MGVGFSKTRIPGESGIKDLELAALSLSSHITISSNTHDLSFFACRGSTGNPLKIEWFTAIVLHKLMSKRPEHWTIPTDIQGPNPTWCCASDRGYSLVSIQLSILVLAGRSRSNSCALLQASRPNPSRITFLLVWGVQKQGFLSDWAIIYKHNLPDPRLLLCSQGLEESFPPWLYFFYSGTKYWQSLWWNGLMRLITCRAASADTDDCSQACISLHNSMHAGLLH
jgi:hypothetical protein